MILLKASMMSSHKLSVSDIPTTVLRCISQMGRERSRLMKCAFGRQNRNVAKNTGLPATKNGWLLLFLWRAAATMVLMFFSMTEEGL